MEGGDIEIEVGNGEKVGEVWGMVSDWWVRREI